MSTAERAYEKRWIIALTSFLLASLTPITSMPRAFSRSAPIHFLFSSLSQLVTRETGHATIECVTAGLPSAVMPCVMSVHRIVIDCSVLPRPMSSARMQPHPAYSRKPMRQSNRNCVPSRWCARRYRQSFGSTDTGFGRSAFGFVALETSSLTPPSPAPTALSAASPSVVAASPSPLPAATASPPFSSSSSSGGGSHKMSGSK